MFNDSDMPKVVDDKAPDYFSVGLGVNAGLSMLSLSDFNTSVSQKFVRQDIPSLLTLGGQAFISISPSIRVGYVGNSASFTSDRRDTVANGNKVQRELELTTSTYSLSVDYVHKLAKSLYLVPSLQLGYGTMDLTMRQGLPDHISTDMPEDFVNPSVSKTHLYHSTYFPVSLHLQLEYALTWYLMVRPSVGYRLALGQKWEKDNGIERLSNADETSNLSGSGAMIGLGIFVGLFR